MISKPPRNSYVFELTQSALAGSNDGLVVWREITALCVASIQTKTKKHGRFFKPPLHSERFPCSSTPNTNIYKVCKQISHMHAPTQSTSPIHTCVEHR